MMSHYPLQYLDNNTTLSIATIKDVASLIAIIGKQEPVLIYCIPRTSYQFKLTADVNFKP